MHSVFSSPRRLGPGLLVLWLLALTASGCGTKTGTISGKVSYQGKTLSGGYVNFLSEAKGAPVKSSAIQQDGSYSVSSVPIGPATITVQGIPARKLSVPKGMPGAGDVPKSDGSEVFVPPQYANAEQSGLKYDIQPGSQQYNIELK